MTDFYFDASDYNDPIKVNLVNDFEYFPASEFTKEITIKVRKNHAKDYNNPYLFSSSNDHSFYSVGNVLTDFYVQDTDNKVITFRFELDSKYTEIERRVYTIGDMFSQIGGLAEILTTIAILIVGSFTSKLYISSLISSLYLVDSDTNIDKIRPK